MDYRDFSRTLEIARSYNEADFIEVELAYNGVRGAIHHDTLAKLLANRRITDLGLLHLSPDGRLIIGQGLERAKDVTKAFYSLTKILTEENLVRPLAKGEKPEYCRIVDEWDDANWRDLRRHTPICPSEALKIFGFPRGNCHCVGVKIIDDQINLVFGERAEASHAGEYDHMAGGKLNAFWSRLRNMLDEILTETLMVIGVNDPDHRKPVYLGDIYTSRQYGKNIFNRHIALYMHVLQDDQVPQPTSEVRAFHTIPLNTFFRHVALARMAAKRPRELTDQQRTELDKAPQYPYYLPVGVFYAAAHILKDQSAKGHIKISDIQSRILDLIIQESEDKPLLSGTGIYRFRNSRTPGRIAQQRIRHG